MKASEVLIEAVPIELDSGEVVWCRFTGTNQCGEMEAAWADLVYRTGHPVRVAWSLKRFVRRKFLKEHLDKFSDERGLPQR